MPTFTYTGKQESGTEVSGTIEARSKTHATHLLRQQGIWISALKQHGAASPPQDTVGESVGRHWSLFYGLWPIMAGTMGNFYQQLANLYRAGVGMQSLVQDTAARVGSARLRRILLQVAPAVSEGEVLSRQLAQYPQVFPRAAVGMLRAGELTGNLDELAGDLADEYIAHQKGWWLVAAAKLYFSIVVLLCVLVPSFPGIIGHDTIQEGLAWWGGYVVSHVLPWVALAMVLFMLYRIVWALPPLAGVRDWFDYYAPLRGTLTRRAGLARFYRVLELCVRAGVDFPVALETAAEATGNRVMIGQLMEAAVRVRRGQPLYDALVACRFMTRETLGLLSSAEAAGSFDETLPRMVDQAKASRDGMAKTMRVGGLVSAYTLVSLAVLIAAAIGYRNIYESMAQKAGFTLEELIQ